MTTGEKLGTLDQTLTGVENELLRRKVARQDDTIDGALDIINQAAEAGAIALDNCDGCDDDDGDGGTQDGGGSDDDGGSDDGDGSGGEDDSDGGDAEE